MDINQAIFRFVIAGVIGAVIGLEREKASEHSKEIGPIGIRTDILVGILGAAAVYLSAFFGNWVFMICLISTVFYSLLPLIKNGHKNSHDTPVSYKTSISTVIVFLMGALAFAGEVQVALAVAVLTTFVLSLKYTLHKFIYGLDYGEIIDAVKFVIIAFIVLPFLPNQAFDHQLIAFIEPTNMAQSIHHISTDIINPYRIWLLIVIISGINFLGYIMVRLFGRDRAYGFTGLIGGFYSSTVTSLNLANTSKNYPDIRFPFVAGILMACGSSFFKMIVLLRTLNENLFNHILPSLLAMSAYLLISGGLFHLLAQRKNKEAKLKSVQKEPEKLTVKSPLNLKSAIRLAFFVIVTMLAANLILEYADINLYYALAAIMAFFAVDDPIIISTASIAGTVISLDLAKNIIIGVVFLNMIQKLATVYFFGNRKLLKPLALGFVGLALVTVLAFLYL